MAGKKHSKELSTDEIKRVMNDLKEMGVWAFDIVGGEPLLRPDLFEIFEYAKKIDLRVMMIHDPGAYSTNVLENPPTRIQDKISEFKPHMFVFGHWHVRYSEYHNGIFCFNPGSVTKKYNRDGKPGFAKIWVRKESDNGKFTFETNYYDL